MNLEYAINTDRPFDKVVADVEKFTVEHGFKVLHIHNVQETLAGKGFDREPLKIIEICNAKFAHKALSKDMMVSLFMPCKINVYTESGKTKIKAMRPALIAEFFPQAGLNDLAAEAEKIIMTIVDQTAKGE
ncbi:MAG: DUF302 domain-containing protein [candidate division Zixibacteria bacterium]|nr:DUF302 domain-containing protein [candidate division Zixibacteria bacterium]